MQIQATRSPLHWANAFYWNHQGANIIYNIYHYLNYHQLVMKQIFAQFLYKMFMYFKENNLALEELECC